MTSSEDRKTSGLVFNIQKYSIHDGPGIRTIVFFKGCPLACRWCSNPESQAFKVELAFNAGRCLGLDQCQRCLKACAPRAISERDGKPDFDRALCADCARPCVEACPASGVITYGQSKTVEQALGVVEQDALFYSRSGGGLTLSGGEPLAQPQFALALLREARRRRIGTALETCGHVPWQTLAAASELLNFAMFDIKSLDAARHEEFTGHPPALALDNLKRLVRERPGLPVHVRTPVIPGFNDTDKDIESICAFIKDLPTVTYELLPYHRLGTQKYHFLGRQAPMGEVTLPAESFARLEALAKDRLGGKYAGQG
jgi:pyruvate formate lyase activating enzyme